MKRRVLIVVSSYAPTMIADMHRARLLAWELPKLGWEIEILAPDASYQKVFCLDPDSESFFPPAIPVHYVRSCCRGLLLRMGLGSIGWRALLPMLFKGLRLLGSRRFDLVYLATTQFPLFLLGPAWNRLMGVPYVLDFHDPLCRYEATPVWARPHLKNRLSRDLGCWIESVTVKRAVGLITVSPLIFTHT